MSEKERIEQLEEDFKELLEAVCGLYKNQFDVQKPYTPAIRDKLHRLTEKRGMNSGFSVS